VPGARTLSLYVACCRCIKSLLHQTTNSWPVDCFFNEKRFGDKFTEIAVFNRDLDGERKVLEDGVAASTPKQDIVPACRTTEKVIEGAPSIDEGDCLACQ
jgi:hypothetical protein